MAKIKLLSLLFLLLAHVVTNAQMPDSVYIGSSYIQFIYKADTIPTIREFNFENGMVVKMREYQERKQYWQRDTERMFAYSELDFNQNLDSLLIGNRLSKYTFFAPDRYIEIDGGKYNNGREDKEFIECETNNWKQYAIDSLNILILYNAYYYIRDDERDRDDIKVRALIVLLKGNRYFYNDSIYTLQPDTLNIDYKDLFWSRQNIHDVDAFSVNNRYGLYTLTGKEVIPAVYDSIKTDEVYVRAFDGRKTIIFDYLGNVIKDNIKRAHPALYRYQILDNGNQVYYMDRDGNRHETYSYGIMSVDDIIYPLPYDFILTPPKKKGYDKKKNYHWVNFIYLWEREDRERMKKINHSLERMDFFDESGISALLPSALFDRRLSDYDLEVYEIPEKYKKPLLVSGEEELRRSGDYESLPAYWLIVKYKGKYGVIDVRDTENQVLPFIYDKIEGNTTSLTLHRKGLKCHYPISDIPRYKELAPIHWKENFIRFTLPDGRKGWLLKNGEEFLDNEE